MKQQLDSRPAECDNTRTMTVSSRDKSAGAMPRRAMILAAGYGTRMRPLSDAVPKAVMPLWNRSLLARAFDLVRAWGVRDVLINTHHGAAMVFEEARALSAAAGRVHVVYEPEILGTGGALSKAAWFFDDAPFWLLNADVVAVNVDPTRLLRRLRARDTIAACWVTADKGPRTVAVRRRYVTAFSAADPGAPRTYTFCGVQLVRPAILSYLPKQGFASLIDAYEKAMQDNWRVAAETMSNAYWADVGTPERYIQTHRETARFFAPSGARADVCVAPGARIAPRARLHDSVVWADAVIHSAGVVANAIVGQGMHVRGPATGIVVPAESVLSPSEWAALMTRDDETRDAQAHVLPARGSGRSYIRVVTSRRSAIVMRYDPARLENTYYASWTRFLRKHQWPVPALWAHKPSEHWMLVEDAGARSLADAVAANPDAVYVLYGAVLDRLVTLQGHVTNAFRKARFKTLPPFDATVYRYERALFMKHISRTWPSDKEAGRRINRELCAVARLLQASDHVLVHRDFQSSNILVSKDAPVFIDFQGMRFGPAAYDLASLLYDPYMCLSVAMRERLLTVYARAAPPGIYSEQAYRYACVQRLCQAIGAYGRLARLPGCERFNRYLGPAYGLLAEALAYLPGLPALKALTGQARLHYDR